MAFDWITDETRSFMGKGYLQEGETVESRIEDIAAAFSARYGEEKANKFREYMLAGYYSLATPVWVNFGRPTGLPISCNGVYVGDSIESMVEGHAEVGVQTKNGAGTSGFFGDIRPSGAPVAGGFKADGPVHYLRMFEELTDVVSQGKARRGAFAAYLPIDHPDILDFLEIREVGNAIQNMSIGVTISDAWMSAMEQEGVDVKEGKLAKKDAHKLTVWARVLRKRKETGYPYLFFTDTVNRNKPQVLKDKDIPILASNLCVAWWTEVDVMVDGVELQMPIFALDALFKMGEHEISVKSYNEAEKRVEYKKVQASAMTSKRAKVMRITDQKTGKSITVTPDHPVFTENRGYVVAGELREDDVLNLSGSFIRGPGELEIEYLEEEIPVYDITVEDNHNFYADGILVHNCSEIMLPSNGDWSFVCDLGSMNIYTYDEWKDTDAVEIMTWFLDAVMEEYIEKVRKIRFMERSLAFAETWRALGLGQLGWHSYLQRKSVPFESFEAMRLTAEVSKHIFEKSQAASREMAKELGEPEGMVGYGLRNLTTCAIAPTTSSSFILGQVSPSIEPLRANIFTKDLAKGVFVYRNPHLKEVLSKYNRDDNMTWESILKHKGSVQHLEFLSDHEKAVFKTFEEISPLTIVQQNSVRQKFVDQGISLNLLIPEETPMKDVNQLILEGWRLGIKTFYYQRSSNPSQELVRNIMVCSSCEA
jgi:ribonucleotide reductase alpha subunit